eukprot:scaffold320_cov335-Pavlova_lutheri.AAC.14
MEMGARRPVSRLSSLRSSASTSAAILATVAWSWSAASDTTPRGAPEPHHTTGAGQPSHTPRHAPGAPFRPLVARAASSNRRGRWCAMASTSSPRVFPFHPPGYPPLPSPFERETVSLSKPGETQVSKDGKGREIGSDALVSSPFEAIQEPEGRSFRTHPGTRRIGWMSDPWIPTPV